MGLKFPKDTLDIIERLFASKILKSFPYYGEFWERFVGWNKARDPLLLPYDLDFPSGTRQKEKERIYKIYRRIVVFHYSLFCQLAGAHFQLDQGSAALENSNKDKLHFLFWEAFDSFYIHLGNARFQMGNLWEEICKITCLPYSQSEDGLVQYLQDENRNDLVQRIQKIRDNIIRVRNNIVHYARNMYVFIEGKYYIPLPIKKEPSLEEMLNHKEAQEATKNMETDLHRLEGLLNEVLPLVGNKLQKGLDSRGIRVRR